MKLSTSSGFSVSLAVPLFLFMNSESSFWTFLLLKSEGFQSFTQSPEPEKEEKQRELSHLHENSLYSLQLPF